MPRDRFAIELTSAARTMTFRRFALARVSLTRNRICREGTNVRRDDRAGTRCVVMGFGKKKVHCKCFSFHLSPFFI